MRACSCVCTHPYVSMRRPEIKVKCLPLFLSTLSVNIGPLTKPQVCLTGSWDPSPCLYLLPSHPAQG